MNVLVCAACGRRLSPPLRLLPELPERPEYDGQDGARQAPSTVPRGTYAVDPEPSGGPYVPHPDPEWMGAARPGAVMLDPDSPGCLMSAGPRDTLVVHPADDRGFLSPNADVRSNGCRSLPEGDGPDGVCPGCGVGAASSFSSCTGPYETHFLPDAVRTVPA
ncbi:hypothetical protein SRB17_74540 [Streptomyces sp. RB17]|uniref:hypothetical protein n=1 Tax=Streptomyces sp. RB17 TaxID=2585197 RepID=UPI00130B3683|nr:hypothetical protein [Streptomyces sp. RB17]MQY39427.1 hypothetical protein [Streptomyces sp. RB17]